MTDTTTPEGRVRAFLDHRAELMEGAARVGAPQLMPDLISAVQPEPDAVYQLTQSDLTAALNVAHQQGFAEGEAAAQLQAQYTDPEQ